MISDAGFWGLIEGWKFVSQELSACLEFEFKEVRPAVCCIISSQDWPTRGTLLNLVIYMLNVICYDYDYDTYDRSLLVGLGSLNHLS